MPRLAVAVEQRADADGVAGGDQKLFATVVQNHRELGVKVLEHIEAVLVVQRQDDLAVGVGVKVVALGLQLGLDGAEAIQLAVAGDTICAAEEGLHALRRQTHDGKAAKAQQTELGLDDALGVGPRLVVRSRYSVKVSVGRSCPA